MIDLEEYYYYTFDNGDTVKWKLKDLVNLMANMGRTYEGCLYSGRLKKAKETLKQVQGSLF